MEFLPLVKNILILDSKGGRLAVKYYTDDWPTFSEQKKFEEAIFNKAQKEKLVEGGDHVTVLGNNIAIYTFSKDLYFVITGSEDENELILADVLNGFYNAVDDIAGEYSYTHRLSKSFVLQNLDTILPLLDVFIDRGIILGKPFCVVEQ